ncbi:peptidoglycan-binding protein [Anabaena cylindrica UHCC 0172]|uniref:peptidoglycan-binding protein n=1 Tax=Anabaena cylindrica TaxID=1165 RepID=UPI002B1F7935|nr:peptidoglycan-binding protein [Anabaena cylindrica]MEA5554211.1 peptidoglycan-binding protein [Anabaena cylindrica UHCC 0172]
MREIKKQENQVSNKQKIQENQLLLFPIPHFILVFTSCFCLGLYPNRAIATTPNLAPFQPTILNPGMTGAEVQVLQVQLKALGYYNDWIDGQYGLSTQNAVAKFQKAGVLKREDGIADLTTQSILKKALLGQTKCTTVPVSAPIPQVPQVNTKSQPNQVNWIWWSLLGLGSLGSVGAFVYLIQRINKIQNSAISENQKLLSPSVQDHPKFFLSPAQTPAVSSSIELLQPNASAMVAKINIFDELIKELGVDDPTLRRKAIWNLGQQGDSRAIKPLVELMMDADSQQHGLILSALAEIGSRTLKPLNRALVISLQNESPQVRKNAIRDLLRIYDMMGQMSQILRHALEDPDPEVQATARYAFTKMNHVGNIPEAQVFTNMNTEEQN